MHNGYSNGNRHGSGKRWLLVGLLILFGFWMVNDSYRDGYTDALVQTGQVENVRYYRGGPHFPWGLVILGGIGFIAWRKGAFDRFGRPGSPFGPGNGNGERGIQHYGGGGGAAPAPGGGGFNPGFRGPRSYFDEWHRQAHETASSHVGAPPAPPAPAAPAPDPVMPAQPPVQSPPPPPPAPEYWASMAPPAQPNTPPSAAPAPPASPVAGTSEPPRDPAGPALERW